ncbi:C-C motif chemokine 22 isoform X1 [Ursus maritimus]|uniref:C-C motif chemokine n=1 Tax=Ursus maritimus TaxID=29073 RepID=A0A384D179_URSMA|nr:C-C motif chemokine 22 isoform X1 [Ursus maritimus]
MRTEVLAGRLGPRVRCLCPACDSSERPPTGPYGANVEDSICCRDYFRHPLPLRMLKFFYWTSDSCRRPGVVFLTVKDREICADPRMPWVKKILQKLDQ